MGVILLIWLRAILYYMVDATDTIQIEDLDAAVKKLGPRGENLMPTLAMQYQERGAELGRLEGFRLAIVNVLGVRFKEDIQTIEGLLDQITSTEVLTEASQMAGRCESLKEFSDRLSEQVKSSLRFILVF